MPASVVSGITRCALPAYAKIAVFVLGRSFSKSRIFSVARASRVGCTSCDCIDGVTFTTMTSTAVSSANGAGSRSHVGPASRDDRDDPQHEQHGDGAEPTAFFASRE